MGRHYRRGHYRTSKNGTRHWVSGHTVDRDSGFGPPYRTSHRLSPTTTRVPKRAVEVSRTPHRPSRPRGLPNPNSTCPVCGAAVYFYSNTAGSKVYFDELGPPWPKHPCMDSRQFERYNAWLSLPRPGAEASAYSAPGWAGGNQVTRDSVDEGRRRTEVWYVEHVAFDHLGMTMLLRREGPYGPRSWWRLFGPANYWVPVPVGHLVFISGPVSKTVAMSFVDPATLDVRVVYVSRISSSWAELTYRWWGRRKAAPLRGV